MNKIPVSLRSLAFNPSLGLGWPLLKYFTMVSRLGNMSAPVITLYRMHPTDQESIRSVKTLVSPLNSYNSAAI